MSSSNTTAQDAAPSTRLKRLLGFVTVDPANLNLLADAASAAFDAQDYSCANDLIDRYETLAPLSAGLANLKAMVALAEGNFGTAAATLEAVRRQGDDSPALRFNLAWAKAGVGAYQEALDLLDDETVAMSPHAPSLKIHAMHHLGLYDDALACGRALAARFPENEALMGALATLALDAEKTELALHYAQRAGHNPEGRAALGILTLGAHDTTRSLKMFDEAIAAEPDNPRAWMGKGLGLLAAGDAKAAGKAIDRGAALFGDHIGSWIASGWAHFVVGENAEAQASFEKAMAIDPNFSECHGGLAVLDIVAGKLEDAKRKTDVALRLDRNCFGGALAKSLLLERAGHARAAEKIREIALSTPIGPNKRTIAEELIAFKIRSRPASSSRNGAGPK